MQSDRAERLPAPAGLTQAKGVLGCQEVERFHQTLMREWAYALEYASSDARGEALPHWLRHYNERRSHSALGNRPPMARVRDV